jgi:hypothetical protein
MKVPIYQGQQRMSTDTPNVEMDTRVAGSQGRQLQQSGEAISELAQKFGKLRDQTEVNQKKLELANNLDQIEREALEHPDPYKAMDEANAKAKKVLSGTSSGITSPSMRAEYDMEAGLHMQAKLSSLNTVLRRKQVDKSTSVLMQLNDKHEQDFYNASTPKEQQLAKELIKLNTDKIVGLGGMSNEQGYKYIDKKYSDMRVGQASSVIEKDPEYAYKELQKGKNGIFPDLEETERKKLFDEAKEESKKRGEQIKVDSFVARDKTQADLVDKLWEGSLDKNTLKQLHEKMLPDGSRAIDDGFFNTMMKAVSSPKSVDALTKFDKYNELATKAPNVQRWMESSTSKIKRIVAFRNEVIDAVSDGLIEKNDGERLLFPYSNTVSTKGKVTTGKFDKYFNDEYKRAIKKVASVTDQYKGDKTKKDEIKFKMLTELGDSLREGEDIDTKFLAILKRVIEDDMGEAGKVMNREVKFSKKENKVYVFENGNLIETVDKETYDKRK